MTEKPISKAIITQISPREFIFSYIKYVPFVLFCLAIALVIAWLQLRYSTPIYRVSGTMIVQSDNAAGDKLDKIFSGEAQTENLTNDMEILKSRNMMKRVVKALGLQTSYISQGKIRSTIIYRDRPFELEFLKLRDSLGFAFSIQVSADKNTFLLDNGGSPIRFGEVFENTKGVFRLNKLNDNWNSYSTNDFLIQWRPLEATAGSYAGGVRTGMVGDWSNIIQISYESPNPKLAADIVNQLMKEYDAANIEDKNRIAVNTLNFIDERLDSLKSELSGVETDLQRLQEANDAIDMKAKAELFLNNLDENERNLNAALIQQSIADEIINYLTDEAKRDSLVPTIANFQADPTIGVLITEYNKLQLDLETRSKTVPPGNPIIQALNAAIEKRRQDILENLANTKRNQQVIINQLNGRIASDKKSLRAIPGQSKQLLDVDRQQKIKQELYLYLLMKKEETAVSAAATISNSRIIDSAIENYNPIRPNRRGIYTLCISLGLLIPIGLIMLKEYLNDRVTTRGDVEHKTDAPIMGEISHSDEKEATLVVSKNNRKFIAEQFRMIRTNLQYILKNKENPVILVSSSYSGEGKSFVSVNMGAVMALAGKKTVILEFDIRKPKVASGLNIVPKAGISSYLVGKSQAQDLPVKVNEIDNLYIIPCGPVPPNPAEMILDPKIGELFAYCREHFDVIVVDTAPIGMVSDAIVLSQYADATLFIIRQGYTHKKQLALVNELYESNKLPHFSLVINDIKAGSGYVYYYGGSEYGYGAYGYGYGNGQSGYFEPTRQKSFFGRLGSAFNRGKK